MRTAYHVAKIHKKYEFEYTKSEKYKFILPAGFMHHIFSFPSIPFITQNHYLCTTITDTAVFSHR